jgi:methylenetetrahydrofolate reductase (NADPH)
VDNRLREGLAKGRFTVTVEVVAPERTKDLGVAMAPILRTARALAQDPRVAALSVTDRVKSDHDHDPVRVALEVGWASGKAPLVHFSGKDRTPADLEAALERMDALGLDNLLCVTGDRLKTPPADRPVRYLDSVNAIALARGLRPASLVAAAVSPFKYTEEATLNQYLKMGKKHRAGADYLITQVGWDVRKLADLRRYRAERGLAQPVVAGLMLLPPGAARYLHEGHVPGVVVTDDLLALVESEARAPDRGAARRFERLALQIVGAELMGYAGAQLSGLARSDDVGRTLELAAGWRDRLRTLEDWSREWQERHRLPGGAPARLAAAPAYFRFAPGPDDGAARPATAGERARYRALAALGRALFDRRSPVHRLLRPLARRVPPDSAVAEGLMRIERLVKAPLFGCRACGFCRLPETFYVCPETCPKGLANGPCGGSAGNTCEAGDRECIHSVKYRLAKAAGALDDLERTVIPPVPPPHRGSSWLNHYAGRNPENPSSPHSR